MDIVNVDVGVEIVCLFMFILFVSFSVALAGHAAQDFENQLIWIKLCRVGAATEERLMEMSPRTAIAKSIKHLGGVAHPPSRLQGGGWISIQIGRQEPVLAWVPPQLYAHLHAARALVCTSLASS